MIVETDANPESDISETTEVLSPRAGAGTCKNLKAVGDGRGLLQAVSSRLRGAVFMAARSGPFCLNVFCGLGAAGIL